MADEAPPKWQGPVLPGTSTSSKMDRLMADRGAQVTRSALMVHVERISTCMYHSNERWSGRRSPRHLRKLN
jgi:hypothetical protein